MLSPAFPGRSSAPGRLMCKVGVSAAMAVAAIGGLAPSAQAAEAQASYAIVYNAAVNVSLSGPGVSCGNWQPSPLYQRAAIAWPGTAGFWRTFSCKIGTTEVWAGLDISYGYSSSRVLTAVYDYTLHYTKNGTSTVCGKVQIPSKINGKTYSSAVKWTTGSVGANPPYVGAAPSFSCGGGTVKSMITFKEYAAGQTSDGFVHPAFDSGFGPAGGCPETYCGMVA